MLAVAVYGQLRLRYAGDLDLMIHRRDLAPAMELLLARGYRLLNGIDPHSAPEPTVTEYQFESAKDAIVVELRWRVTESWLSASLDLEDLIARAEPRAFNNAQVLMLPAEETLLALCVHGAKHCWERLMWICDIAELVKANPSLDWNHLREQSRARGLWGQVLLGLLVAREVLDLRLPQEALKWREDLGAIEQQATELRQRLFESRRTPHSIFSARLQNARYWMSMLERPDERVLQGLKFLFLLFPGAQINEKDRQFVALPHRYRFFYPLLRPIRLARDYAGPLFGWKTTGRQDQ